jgi:hypothetical protein
MSWLLFGGEGKNFFSRFYCSFWWVFFLVRGFVVGVWFICVGALSGDPGLYLQF